MRRRVIAHDCLRLLYPAVRCKFPGGQDLPSVSGADFLYLLQREPYYTHWCPERIGRNLLIRQLDLQVLTRNRAADPGI